MTIERYDWTDNAPCSADYYLEPTTEGEWCQYDDAAAEIERLTVFAGTQTDECARLRAENERLRSDVSLLEKMTKELHLACSIEHLPVLEQMEGLWKNAEVQGRAFQSRLAAATALLKACRSELETDPNAEEYYADLIAELKAFLANKPAAYDPITCPVTPGDFNGPHGQPAANRTEACEWGPHCPACREERGDNARTEAEQAVLDAMGAVPEDTLRRSLANTLHTDEHSRAPARAELARRGLK
jgi:hypothetical protein